MIIMDNRDIISLFLDYSTLKQHIECQQKSYDVYVSNLLLLTLEYKIKLTILKRAMILVSALYLRNTELATFLLVNVSIGCRELPVILKTCQILDSRRFCNQMKKKTDKIKNKNKLAKHKSIISNFNNLHEGYLLSLSKSKIKFIKKNWINKLTGEELESMVLQFPPDQWRKLANLLHLKDSDFGNTTWFLQYIYSKDNNSELPEDTMIYKCSNLNKKNIYNIVKTNNIPYAYFKNREDCKKLMSNSLKRVFLDRLSFEDLLKHWEDFDKSELCEDILNKYNNYNNADIPYGELIKRLLILSTDNKEKLYNSLVNIAQNKLNQYNIEINSPIVVFGDASASMDIAIRTSTIIASIMCNLFGAKLHLFRGKDEYIENVPKTVHDVIEFSKVNKASGSTSPASSLYPYLERKEVVKTFIIVTDEIENVGYDGQWFNNTGISKSFANTFKEYSEKVYPAKLVFVSFLPDNKDGYMVRQLKKIMPNIEDNIVQFRLNKFKPDLRKLDDLLNVLALETDNYQEQCDLLKEQLNDTGFMDLNEDNVIENISDDVIEVTI
jgi:hypothetical protein